MSRNLTDEHAPSDTDSNASTDAEPVMVPYTELSPEALRGVIEAFVLREGTEYGLQDISLDVKVSQVTRQLKRGEAQIVFDPGSETIDIVVVPPGARNR